MRQTLTESLIFGLLGGAAGCGAAWALLRICIKLAPGGMLRLEHARIDLRVLLFALAGSLGAALLFGLAPALEPSRAEALAGWHVTGTARTLFRKALVSAQVAISLVLLTGAAVFGGLNTSRWDFSRKASSPPHSLCGADPIQLRGRISPPQRKSASLTSSRED
jgi:hypothetical protein